PSDEQLSKTIKYTRTLYKIDAPNIEAEAKDPDELTIWFNKEKIILNGEAFRWSDEGITKADTGGNLKSLIRAAPSGGKERQAGNQ
nr:hypothetical protein [Desulfobacula sp.]